MHSLGGSATSSCGYSMPFTQVCLIDTCADCIFLPHYTAISKVDDVDGVVENAPIRISRSSPREHESSIVGGICL